MHSLHEVGAGAALLTVLIWSKINPLHAGAFTHSLHEVGAGDAALRLTHAGQHHGLAIVITVRALHTINLLPGDGNC